MGVSLLNGGKDLLSTDDVGLLGSHLLCWLHRWLLLRHSGLLHDWLLRWHLGSWLLHLIVVLSLSSLVLLGSTVLLVLVVWSRILSSVLVVRLGLLSLHDLEKLLDDLGQVSLVVEHAQRLS